MIHRDNLVVAVYARVSSEQQTKANTITSQFTEMNKRIVEDGFILDQEMCFVDDGYRGATLIRPALERLRDVAATGAIDRLYVHCPDRLARKYAYQVLLVDELQRCGVEVVFLNREIGQTPEDNLLLQVQGMVAEYEHAKILERSRRGKRHAAQRGSVNVLSGAPYGYRYVNRHEGAGQAEYQILLEEVRVVRQVFQWVGADRLSIGEVCKRLKKQGIPTRTGKSYWDRATIWGMLKNPAYKGSAAFGKTKAVPWRPPLRPQRGHGEQPRSGTSTYSQPSDQWLHIPVPALVDEGLYDAVQQQLEENKKRSRQTQRGAKHLLQGLLVCKKCGYAFYGKDLSPASRKGKQRHYAYYRCIGMDAYRFGGQRICDNKQVRTDMLEEVVWNDICNLLADPHRIQQEYERRRTTLHKHSGWQSLDQLRMLIQKVKRGMARLVDAYEDSLIDKEEFEPRIRQAKDRLARLQTQADTQADEEAQQNQLELVIGCIRAFADRVNEGLRSSDWHKRRQIIRTLVKQVEIDQEDVKIVYRIDSAHFAETPEKGIMQDCWRGDHPALWRASATGGMTCSLAPLIPLLDRCPQPQLDQM